MKRLFFVPQLPVGLRYQSWWYSIFPAYLRSYFDEVIVLGESDIGSSIDELNNHKPTSENFSMIDASIAFENCQMIEFLEHIVTSEDVLFLADISFPGFFSNILYHKNVENAYAFCHATSINTYDYFQNVRKAKWKNELAHSYLFKKVFVASNYHKNKLVKNGWSKKNLDILHLPLPPYIINLPERDGFEYDVISVSRQCKQKVTRRIENAVEKSLNIKIKRSSEFKFSNWYDYYKFISRSKVMLITSKEETFGYQVIDALMNQCIPIAPKKFSYPELLPDKFLYSSDEECIVKVAKAIDGVITLEDDDAKIFESCSNFFDSLAYELTSDL